MRQILTKFQLGFNKKQLGCGHWQSVIFALYRKKVEFPKNSLGWTNEQWSHFAHWIGEKSLIKRIYASIHVHTELATTTTMTNANNK